MLPVFRTSALAAAIALAAVSPLRAQTSQARRHTDASELRRVVEALAHDSTAGRPTPSPQLNAAASYVAASLRSAGLIPLGDDTTFFQRYPVSETVLDSKKARVEIGTLATWRFGDDYWHVGGMGGAPFGELRGPVVVVSGNITRENVASIVVRNKIVIYRSPLNARGTPTAFSAGFALGGAGALAVLVPGERPDSTWRRLSLDPEEHKPATNAAWPVWTATAAPLREGMIKFMPVLEVWGGRFAKMLSDAKVDTSSFAAFDAAPSVLPLGVDGIFHFDRQISRITWAPNVVALLRGTDPVLRNEYIVVTAHLDGLGRNPNAPPGPASIFNGADDNASGVAAMIQVAKAISQGARPKRSVIFVAVSGEELGLWGSDYFAARPPVPQGSIVANVNLDMVGRATSDTLYLTGQSNRAYGGIVRGVVGRNNRGLTILDEAALERRYPGEFFDERSDHVNFRRRGIPALSFYTGTHADYHSTTDDADKVNYDGLSRISNLVIDILRAIGDAPIAR